jgi:hypothetical protein
MRVNARDRQTIKRESLAIPDSPDYDIFRRRILMVRMIRPLVSQISPDNGLIASGVATAVIRSSGSIHGNKCSPSWWKTLSFPLVSEDIGQFPSSNHSNSKPLYPKSQKNHVSFSDSSPGSNPFICPIHLICAPEGAGEQKWQTLS